MTLQVNRTLECEGLACPLPVVRTKKAIDGLKAGDVLEIRATDKGSVADLKGWAKGTGNQYIGLKEENGVLIHYIRKSDPSETKEESKFPHMISLDDLKNRLSAGEKLNIVDVREPAEYTFGRLPGALSIPEGDLGSRIQELDPANEYLIVCRTGSRSDRVCQTLADKGYKNVKNVLPGMADWSGEVEKD